MFPKGFDKWACDGDSISCTVDGFDVVATIVRDEDMGEPWKEHDGHGVVSEWTSRAKEPGERVLAEDRGSKRYYDVRGSLALARKDGWDAPPYGGTAKQKAARAVDRDFDHLRAWCNDEWHWCIVSLSVSRNGITLDEHAASLCGIECGLDESHEYLTDTANELLDEAVEAGRKALASLYADVDGPAS